ncbi:ATP-grasp domain-containing protein [Catenulispora rubra]|uniref:ATP-grasp domain-containing protein n=1 Tax=Catenulispora rubra TaxID=280293 RepID=UPI002B27B77E|nr:ATP-grasp domain-containing protein [Catenulispora rubra]
MILDPGRQGVNFKQQAADRGLAVVSVYTMPRGHIQDRWPDHTDGDDVSVYAAGLDEIRSALDQVHGDVRGIVPASDVAVHTVDRLAEALGLPGNGAKLALARRDKAAMRENAQRAGLRIPAFEVIDDVRAVGPAAHRVGFPAILKQTSGAASHGTLLLRGPQDVQDLPPLHELDYFGRPVRSWLVEQYVRGRELAVNCISHDGRHHLVDVWEYRQPDDSDYSFPYWESAQIPHDDPDRDLVVAYVRDVLDAFGVRLGPSHTEVKVWDGRAYLMELGTRLPGGPMIDHWVAHSDLDPLQQTLGCRLGEEPAITTRPVRFDAFGGASAIRNDGPPGRLVEIKGLTEVGQLPGVDKVVVAFEAGAEIPTTDSVRNIPVGVWVHAPDHPTLLRRLADVRAAVELVID